MSAPSFADRRRIVRAVRRFNRAAERSAAVMILFLAACAALVWSVP